MDNNTYQIQIVYDASIEAKNAKIADEHQRPQPPIKIILGKNNREIQFDKLLPNEKEVYLRTLITVSKYIESLCVINK